MARPACKDCKWYTEDAEVCVNDASDHLADFVLPDDGCEEWEAENDDCKFKDNRTVKHDAFD